MTAPMGARKLFDSWKWDPAAGGWVQRRSNYDPADDVQYALAKLQREPPPEGAEVIELTKKAASTRETGFFDRLLEEHFSGQGMFPRRLKDVTKSLFGLPGQEDTITWGQNSTELSLPILTAGDIAAFIGRPLPQTVHVHRDHPTTFSILTVVDYGQGFTATMGENIGIEIDYIVGVGQYRATVKRKLPIVADTALFNGAQQVDQFTDVPLQALQVSARIYDFTFAGAESAARTITLTVLAAPVVM